VSRRRLGALLVLGGSALALAIQVAAPVGVPLYDGVIAMEPYRFLRPVAGQAGDPASYRDTLRVVEGISPVLPAATSESPSQAQLIAQRDAFELTPGVAAIVAEIVPVDPPTLPATGQVLGNAYRFSVTDQLGNPLDIRPCSGCISMVLRAPENSPPGTLMRYSNGTWEEVPTRHAGITAMYQSNVTALGTYAVVSTGDATDGGIGVDLDLVLILAIGGTGLIILAFVALLYLRARPARLPAAQLPGRGDGGPARRVPTKRRGPKRPTSGRNDR
jgi:hypothetical protein